MTGFDSPPPPIIQGGFSKIFNGTPITAKSMDIGLK